MDGVVVSRRGDRGRVVEETSGEPARQHVPKDFGDGLGLHDPVEGKPGEEVGHGPDGTGPLRITERQCRGEAICRFLSLSRGWQGWRPLLTV